MAMATTMTRLILSCTSEYNRKRIMNLKFTQSVNTKISHTHICVIIDIIVSERGQFSQAIVCQFKCERNQSNCNTFDGVYVIHLKRKAQRRRKRK